VRCGTDASIAAKQRREEDAEAFSARLRDETQLDTLSEDFGCGHEKPCSLVCRFAAASPETALAQQAD